MRNLFWSSLLLVGFVGCFRDVPDSAATVKCHFLLHNATLLGGFAEFKLGIEFRDNANNMLNPSLNDVKVCFSVNTGGGYCQKNFYAEHTVVIGRLSPGFNRLAASVTVDSLPALFDKCTLSVESLNGRLSWSVIDVLKLQDFPVGNTIGYSSDEVSLSDAAMNTISAHRKDVFLWSRIVEDQGIRLFDSKFTRWWRYRCNDSKVCRHDVLNSDAAPPLRYHAYYDYFFIYFTGKEARECASMTAWRSQPYCSSIVRFVSTVLSKTTEAAVLLVAEEVFQWLQRHVKLLQIVGIEQVPVDGHSEEFRIDSSARELRLFYYAIRSSAVSTLNRYLLPSSDREKEEKRKVAATVLSQDEGTCGYSVSHDRGEGKTRRHGLKYLQLQHACLDRNGSIVIPSQQYHAVKKLMEAHYAFASFSVHEERHPTEDSDSSGGRVVTINATAAMIKPYYEEHTFHHLQSLTALFHAAYEIKKRLDHVQTQHQLSNGERQSIAQELHGFVLRARYLLLPSYDPHSLDYEWTTSILTVFTDYLEEVRALAAELGVLSAAEEEGDVVTMLMQPQWQGLLDQLQQNNGVHQVCFSELVLIGQADTNRGFFGDVEEIDEFRALVWDMFLSNEDEGEHNVEFEASAALSSVPAASANASAVDMKGDYSNAAGSAGKRKLKVVFVLRHHNRRILNMSRLYAMLMRDPVLEEYLDREWLEQRGYVMLEWLTFQEQVQLMYETDVFIGVHGSAFANALFMQPHSAVIALMQSRHIEFVLPQVVQQGEVAFHFLPVLDQTAQTRNCMPYSRTHCDNASLLEAGRFECMGLRGCDVFVEEDWFHALVGIAARHVLANKY